MPGSELIDYLKFSERYSLEWSGFIELEEVVVALRVQSLNFAEEHSEHGERVKLLVDLFKLLTNNDHAMLHTEEAIADNYYKLVGISKLNFVTYCRDRMLE